MLIAGTASGGNSTSTTGPAMATTRPSFKVGVLSVTVMSDLQDQRVVVLLAVAGAAMAAGEVEYVQSVVGQEVGVGRLAGAERLGATDDLHDLGGDGVRSEEHTSELQSLMRISYAVFCLKNKKTLISENITAL